MKTRANILVGLLTINACLGVATAFAATNLSLFDYNVGNKVIPNCHLRKEYNYFMNQWTTNEVCDPSVVEYEKKSIPARNNTSFTQDSYYVAPVYNNSAPIYNTYTGYYANNNSVYTPQTWNGYGSASNYLLGSFGGGIGSYGYYNNYYPLTLYTYLPSTSYRTYSYWDDSYSSSRYYAPDSSYWDNPKNHDYDFGVGFGLAAGRAGYTPDEAVQLYNDYYGTDY